MIHNEVQERRRNCMGHNQSSGEYDGPRSCRERVHQVDALSGASRCSVKQLTALISRGSWSKGRVTGFVPPGLN